MVIDIFGVATFLMVLLLGAIMILYNSRQARALEAANGVLENWLFLHIKDRRAKRSSEIQISDPLDWIHFQIEEALGSGTNLVEVKRVNTDLPVIDVLTSDGRRVVVSPQEMRQIKRSIHRLKTSGSSRRLADFADVPLLGRNPRRVEAYERNLVNAGEWFDLEAAQVGEALNVGWGQVNRLWFYLIPAAMEA